MVLADFAEGAHKGRQLLARFDGADGEYEGLRHARGRDHCIDVVVGAFDGLIDPEARNRDAVRIETLPFELGAGEVRWRDHQRGLLARKLETTRVELHTAARRGLGDA